MALPNSSDLASLDYVYLGAPFVQVEAKNLDTENLDFAYLGAPFVAVGPGSNLNVYIKSSGVWSSATAMYVKVSGVWKTVTDVSVKVGGVWKT